MKQLPEQTSAPDPEECAEGLPIPEKMQDNIARWRHALTRSLSPKQPPARRRSAQAAAIPACFQELEPRIVMSATNPLVEIPTEVQSLVENLQGQEFGTDGWSVVADSHPNVPLVLRRNVAGQQRDMVVVLADGTIERYVRNSKGGHEHTQFLGNAPELADHPDVLIGLMAQEVGDEVRNGWLTTLGVDMNTSGSGTDEILDAVTASLAEPTYIFALQEAHLVEKQEAVTALQQELQSTQETRNTMLTVAETLVPEFQLTKNQKATSAVLNHTNATVGSEIVVVQAYGDGKVVLRETIHKPTGSMALQTPYVNDRGGHYAYIIAPDGTKSYIGIWDTAFGKNFGNVTRSVMPAKESEKLEHGNPEHAQLTAEQVRLEAEIEVLKRKIATLEEEINQLEIEIAETLTLMNTDEQPNGVLQMGDLKPEVSKQKDVEANNPQPIETVLAETFTDDMEGWRNAGGSSSVSNGYLNLSLNGRVTHENPVPRAPGEVIHATIVLYIGGHDRFILAENYDNTTGKSIGSLTDIMSRDYLGFIVSTTGQTHKRPTGGDGKYIVEEVLSDEGNTVTVTRPNGTKESFTFTPVDSTSYTPAMYGWKNVAIDSVTVVKQSPVKEEPAPEPEPEPETGTATVENTAEQQAKVSALTSQEIEQLLQAIQEEIDAYNQALEDAQSERDSLSNIQEMPTPEYQLKKPVNATSVKLTFQNAVVGSELVIKKGYGDGGVAARKKISEASGSISVGNPNVFDRVKYFAYIVAPNGTEANIGQWETIYGKNMGRNNLTMPDTERAKLSYENPLYEEQQQQKVTLEAEIQELEQSIASHSVQYEESRAEIPLYNRLHVSAGEAWDRLNINYMTPADETEIVVQVQNPTLGQYNTRRFNTTHDGGTYDGYIDASLYNITSSGSTITVSMLVNGQVADQVTLRQQNAGVSGGSNWEWGTFEHGLATENPLDSAMEIVATNGAQLSIAAQTAYDNVNIVMEGGGYLSRYNANTEGGKSLFMQNFAFNASKPSGNYSIKMYDTRNGMLLNEIAFYWDAGSKTITPAESGQRVAALQAPEMQDYIREMQEQVSNQAELGEIDIGFTSLRTVQRTFFSERSAHFIPDSDFDTILANFPLPDHPDAGSILNEGMAVYNETLGELLQEAARVAIAAWNGEDQEAAVEAFYRRYDELSQLRKLNEFKIDFKMTFPTADEILADGMNIVQEHIGDLQVIQAKEISMRKRSAYLASKEGPETERKISEAARLHNLMVVEAAHGKDSEQYEAYVGAWDDDTSAEVDTEEQSIDAAIEEYKRYLDLEYANDPEGYNNALKEYLESLDYYVVSYEEEKSAEKDYVRAAVVSAMTAGDNPIMVASAGDVLDLYEDISVDEFEFVILREQDIKDIIMETMINLIVKATPLPQTPAIVGDIGSLYSEALISQNIELSEDEEWEALQAAIVAEFAYDGSIDLPTFMSPINNVDLDIANGHLEIKNAGIVFLEVKDGDDTNLYIGFEGTNFPTNPFSMQQHREFAADLFDDVYNINDHIDMPQLLDTIDELLSDNEYKKVIVGGHSLGGSMAQLFMGTALATDEEVFDRFSAYTFGSPGIMNEKFNDRRIINFLHADDLIPYMGAVRGHVMRGLPLNTDILPSGDYIRSGYDYYMPSEADIQSHNLLAPHSLDEYISSLLND